MISLKSRWCPGCSKKQVRRVVYFNTRMATTQIKGQLCFNCGKVFEDIPAIQANAATHQLTKTDLQWMQREYETIPHGRQKRRFFKLHGFVPVIEAIP